MALHPSIRIEGGLLGPDIIDQVLAGDLPGQRPGDFGLEARRNLTDEIAAAFADARALWGVFQHRLERLPPEDLATSVTRDAWMIPFLGLLGYEPRYNQRAYDIDGLTFAISHRAGESEDSPPVHIVGIRQELGRVPASGRPRLAPHSLVQEYLNRTEQLWGIVTNGQTLRLLRDCTFVRRQAYVEFDLPAMLEEQQFQDFAALYRLLHRTRLPRGTGDADECLLEKYYLHSVEQGGRVREHLRDGVEECLKLLANGFLHHPANDELRRRISPDNTNNDRLTADGFYRQLLILVYRFLFLLVSEDRGLLGADPLYREHYSIGRLRRMLDQRAAFNDYDDLWQSLRVLWLVLIKDQPQPALNNQPLASVLGLPVLNGDLFAPLALDGFTLTNNDLLSALWRLAWYQESQTSPPRRVNYAALDVEELGSVYESLLEFHPAIDPDAAGRPAFSFVTGSERKTTGSYYTPPELVGELIKSALEPVIVDRLQGSTTQQEKVRALLSIRVCDPACGSGHFLLAAARRLGKELARVRTGEDEPAPERVREAIRDVVSHCIYGVDRNPLAVDLCRVALWLESHTADKPLTFLDHRIRCGDSLVGVFDLDILKEGVPDKAFDSVEGDSKAVARELARRNRNERSGVRNLFDWSPDSSLATWQRHSRDVDSIADDSPEAIRRKRQLFEESHRDPAWMRQKQACDLWTAAFFQRFTDDVLPITSAVLADHTAGRPIDPRLLGTAAVLSVRQRFFHWPLEFPEIFPERGFDVVLGNPPWGAALSDGDKKTVRAKFSASQRGKIDTFAVFTELSSRLLNERGWFGLVLPDIVLLKNYPDIRLHLLEFMTLQQIAHWGQAFSAANIDVCTISASRGSPPPDHVIRCVPEVLRGDATSSPANSIKQETFLHNKEYRFNLQLSDSTVQTIDALRALGPKVGELFTIREGVHSGNVRAKLFLDEPVGPQCKPLLFGRDEIEPMRLRWAGKYIQLDQSQFDRDAGDYFNVGDQSLYAADKILVRRTGDFLLSAVDFDGRYCSNNFFILVPHENVPRYKLVYAAACLNSRIATHFFRLIQPRVGKLFAELKITHLEEIPIPFWNDSWSDEQGKSLADVLAREDDIVKAALGEFELQLMARVREASTEGIAVLGELNV